MKIVGIVLILVGVVAFLNNTEVIVAGMDWNTIWPLLVIIAGFALKYSKRCGKCIGGICMGGKCEMGKGDEHKCEGAGCGECKKG
ncbi:MAG: hypothetical protein HZB12_01210 [Candidatus Yonathbacteria bacterium]|nr:hypothetical protein [Candidatus Yonathbacteria bacterium]